MAAAHEAGTPTLDATTDEAHFAAWVDACKASSAADELFDLLREEHAVYGGRAATSVVRMRGWVLLALGDLPPSNEVAAFLLEELESGRDPYLVAAAARALRRGRPNPALARVLVAALDRIRFEDDLVSLDAFGAYATGDDGVTAVAELLATLRWLGSMAAAARTELDALQSSLVREGARELADEVAGIVAGLVEAPAPDADCCALPMPLAAVLGRARKPALTDVVLEDHRATTATFGQLFVGQPSVVVFFYSRCDNPRKCSLTVAKLGRLQALLRERGLHGRVRTAAITYDPAYDTAERLLSYGAARGLDLTGGHGLYRVVRGWDELRAHLGLGVGYVASLVNRHRVELFVLDAQGRVARTSERLGWDETNVVDATVELLGEGEPEERNAQPAPVASALVPAFALVTAFFPKCPVCWAAYLSVFGVGWLKQLPYTPWLLPVFGALLLVNLASLWWRGRARGRFLAFWLGCAGAAAILLFSRGLGIPRADLVGVGLTFVAALVNALDLSALRRIVAERSA